METNAPCQVALGEVETGALIKISGTIRHYTCERDEVSFVLAKKDKYRMGMVAVALAATGMGGQAIGTATNASQINEEADFVSFELNGQRVKGWLWRSPFSEADDVDVVAVWQGDYYELMAMAKPSERLIALYPHCVRGRGAFYSSVLKWWFAFAVLFGLASTAVALWAVGRPEFIFGEDFWITGAGVVAGLSFVTVMLARQWAPFAKTSQRIFQILGLPSPASIDLKKTSKAQRKQGDPPEMGAFFFRY
ncbi:putative type VI secretion system effector [Herbaspirillum rubrisubalbicans]|uniref:Uncharacterized protein n=1 Tax=Herbaspirillum rubrisubalbicans TaxID=80842 RepID=A0AAD0UBF2_9BURK|nr:putative type VI secretion system effector [Herbaspirillum rubrisubalbicans]AYR26415.1 hypothetical protein RC54_22500 [Herbaspirillum rubrisubalbicans]